MMKTIETPAKILSPNLFPVVGIGASAGGLDAFIKLLKGIPQNSGMAYVLVQHLDPNHESLLPEILQKVTSTPILEVSDEIRVQPDHIYILPSNKMLVANDGVLLLSPRPEKGNSRPILPIDLFFTSLAEVHQMHSIGVVLSGTGSDGTEGLRSIKEHGGITFAQDNVSAAFNSMPFSAIQAGIVDFILPPDQIPKKILEIMVQQKPDRQVYKSTTSGDEAVFNSITSLLRSKKGTDFTFYKQTTIQRRITRRMALNQNGTPSQYFEHLKTNKKEQDALYQDLLISVTAFFRDQKSFDNLCKLVFPLLLTDNHEPIRIWVAACSTGEEAYSLAICLRAFLGDAHKKVQLFATDISEPAIAKARTGSYSLNEVAGLPPKFLNDYFTKIDENFVINKSIRDMCVFARHDFLKDPPFRKIDLISCRNVLIYMESYLQKKALVTFHYALNSRGFMLLGKSETISSVPELFISAVKNDKLFMRRDVGSKFINTAARQTSSSTIGINSNSKKIATQTDFQKVADDIMLSNYTPPGVVVNDEMGIVYFRGNTGSYLEQAPGKPSHHLLKMAKHGLAFELRNILHKVKKTQASFLKKNISVEINAKPQLIDIEVIPLTDIVDPHYLILFHNATPTSTASKPLPNASKTKTDEKTLRIQRLEAELAQTHEDMRSITEDQEAANQELQSANEELLSSSEELQSLNEELETSKEELQSTNEELITVNQELVNLNEQIMEAKSYAEAIVTTVREPLVVLDQLLKIKTANNAFYKTFSTNKAEIEDKSIYEVGNQQWNIPALRVLLEKILPEKKSFIDFEVELNFQTIGQRTMLLNAREIAKSEESEKLILLAIEDITERKKNDNVLKKNEAQFRQLADLMPQKIFTADAQGNLTYYNQKWLDYTGLSVGKLAKTGWWTFMHPDELSRIRKRWEESIRTGQDFELEHNFADKNNVYQWHLSRAVGVKGEDGTIDLWIGSSTEIQKQKAQSERLEKTVANRTIQLEHAGELLQSKNTELGKMNEELQSFNYVASHDLQEPLRKIQMFSKRILENEIGGLTDKGKDYFDRIQKAAERMQRLIEDLLAYSRVNSGDRKFENIDLNQIIEEVKEDLKEVIEEKNATIEIRELCLAYIIPFQFRQLMANLISNSLKFTKPNVPPHIIIASTNIVTGEADPSILKHGKEYCHISIKDNGIGFDPEYKDKVFELFQRLHKKNDYRGTGIGLSIVKKIVENHNGYIVATGELDKGATFDIYIPVEPNELVPSNLDNGNFQRVP